MSADPRLVAHCDDAGCTYVEPAPGWAWCSDCNGEGTITTMDTGPDMNETEYECTSCDGGLVEVPR